MIPKVLHYCWFGEQNPTLLSTTVPRWKQALSDWEIRAWDEASLDLPSSPYVDWCLDRGHWAHLSDYARAYLLATYGGVYVDTDVEIRRSFDDFVHHEAFSGFERIGIPFTAVWGSTASHPWPAQVMAYLDEHVPVNALTPNTAWMPAMLEAGFGIDSGHDTFQVGDAGVAIYPSETFCVETPASWAVHTFAGSWLTPGHRSYKRDIDERQRARTLPYREAAGALALGELVDAQLGSVPFRSVASSYIRLIGRASRLLVRGLRRRLKVVLRRTER